MLETNLLCVSLFSLIPSLMFLFFNLMNHKISAVCNIWIALHGIFLVVKALCSIYIYFDLYLVYAYGVVIGKFKILMAI